jgi:hypothetical protein
MKNNNYLFKGIVAFVFTALVFASACKKDEILDVIRFDGMKYGIAGGILENFGMANELPASYNFDLTLYSDGIEYSEEYNDFTGTGTLLYFEMFSSDEDDLAPGTYVFDAQSYAANTFDWGVIIVDINFDGPTEIIKNKSAKIAGESIVDGTIKVSKSKSVYTITITATTDMEKQIKATYEGPLPMILPIR